MEKRSKWSRIRSFGRVIRMSDGSDKAPMLRQLDSLQTVELTKIALNNSLLRN